MSAAPEVGAGEPQSFEALMQAIEGLLARLSDGDAPLAQLVQDHRLALQLARRAEALLVDAEARLKTA